MRNFILAASASLLASACASAPTVGADSPEDVGARWAAAMHAGDAAALERLTVPADLLATAVDCQPDQGIARDVARWRDSIAEVAAKGKKLDALSLTGVDIKRQRVLQPGEATDGCTAKQEIRLVDADLKLSIESGGHHEYATESIDVIGIGDRWYMQEQ